MPPAEIRLLTKQEPSDVFQGLARLHAEQIPGGFLTSLGEPLLAHLYRAINGSGHAFVLVAVVDRRLVGFLCGSLHTRRVYRDVLVRAWFRLLPTIARRVLSWRTVQRCWETLRYPARDVAPDLPAAEILNFCVDGKLQRSGIGRQLFSAMEREFARRGISSIRIVTGASQLSAIRFYEKLGAMPAGTIEVHAEVESRLFRYAIASPIQS